MTIKELKMVLSKLENDFPATVKELNEKEGRLIENIELLIRDQDEETTMALWNEVIWDMDKHPLVYGMESFNKENENVAPSVIVARTREGFDLEDAFWCITDTCYRSSCELEDFIDIDLLTEYIVNEVPVDRLLKLDTEDFIGLESLIEELTGIQL